MFKGNAKYFHSSLIVTFIGLILGAAVGYYYSGTMIGAGKFLLICAILAVLEVSISFDNAVVNATVLKDMSEIWVKRFLTWGMLIAVFGMRLVFPLLIVAIVGGLNPWEALKLAALQPDDYARMMTSVHHEVSAFGGVFLMLVSLKYFFDKHKEVHWIRVIEEPLSKMGKLDAIEVGVTLAVVYAISRFVDPAETLPFLYSAIAGVLTYLAVEGIGVFLQGTDTGKHHDIHRASLGMFLYLEVLDASFSFDGVIGAFAITNNLFIIAIGLGIGAMFVRSLTILMVDKGTLNSYRFLEHGAFWAVAVLSVIMFLNTIYHIPEVVTGVIGAVLIALSVYSSIRMDRKERAGA